MHKQNKSRQQMSLSHRGSQLNMAQRFNFVSANKKEISNHTPRNCRFCSSTKDFSPLYHIKNKLWPLTSQKSKSLIKLLTISLPLKYSQSQTYYYTKPINDFLNNQRSKQVIRLKELISFAAVDGDEWMRRFYAKNEQTTKVKLLTEYYRFHNEIPRLFMLPVSDIMNKFIHSYHDKKRRIEYFRIVKEIEDENKKNPDKPPKEIVGDKPDIRREESFDFTQGSKFLEEKFYGNLLDGLNLDQSKTNTQNNKEKNISLTVQELNQRLEEIVQQQKIPIGDLERDFKYNVEGFIKTTEEDDKLNKFLAFLKDKENEQNKRNEKPNKTKKNANLKLNDDVLKIDYQNTGPMTVQPSQKDIIYQIDRKTGKITYNDPNQMSKQSPKSARNGSQITNQKQEIEKMFQFIILSNPNMPFFLSEALAQKIQSQQQQNQFQSKDQQSGPNLKLIQGSSQTIQNISQALQISPRNMTSQQKQQLQQGQTQQTSQVQSPANISNPTFCKQLVKPSEKQQQILAQQIQLSIQLQQQQVKQQSSKAMVKQASSSNLIKSPMQQGFQGSQEAYQMQNEVLQNQVMSTKNQSGCNNQQWFSSNKLNSSAKNASKLSAIITAESSPNLKLKQQAPTVIGSQTHRVTSQANVYRQSKKFDSNSKESLNKLLSPLNPMTTKKEINDNFILQIQSMKQQQQSSMSKPLIKSQVVAQQKICNPNQSRRGSKAPQFRKSLEQNLKLQLQTPKQIHQHTKSEMNNQNAPEQLKRFQ